MSKIADTEANATSLDSLVNDNALVPTLRNGPKPSYQYLVDGWNTEFNALIDNLEVQGDNAIALINADVVTVEAAKNSAISSINSDLSAFDVYYQSARDSLDDDVAEFTIDSDAALADFEAESSNSLSEFAQESAEAFNEFDLTLDQYKESRGFNTKGTFADGFTYELPNDVGLDASGNPWILIDTSSLPVIVSAGTTPTNPPYKQVIYGTASQVSTNTSDTVQSFADSFALKIFQSPTDGVLTEIQTRTINASEVYEVRKTSDDSLATIYSDAAGTTEIVQDGTSNVSDSDGVVEFYIDTGSYYIDASSKNTNFNVNTDELAAFDNVESLKTSNLKRGAIVTTKGRVSAGDGGGAKYILVAVTEYNSLSGNSLGASAKLNGGDGVTERYDITLDSGLIAYKLDRHVVFTEQLCDISDPSAVAGAFVASGFYGGKLYHMTDVVSNYITIDGATRGWSLDGIGSISLSDNQDNMVLRIDNCTGYMSVKGIKLDGNKFNQNPESRNFGAGLRFFKCQGGYEAVRVKVRNNHSGAAILVIDNASDTEEYDVPVCRIAYCDVIDCGDDSFEFSSDGIFANSDRCDIYGNLVKGVTDYAMALDYSQNMNVYRNRCYDFLVGVGILGVKNLDIYSNLFDGGEVGIDVTLAGQPATDQFISNLVRIHDNTVKNISSTELSGTAISIDPSSLNVSTYDNKIDTFSGFGISSTANGAEIYNNGVAGATGKTAYYIGGVDSKFRGNSSKDSAGNPLIHNVASTVSISDDKFNGIQSLSRKAAISIGNASTVMYLRATAEDACALLKLTVAQDFGIDGQIAVQRLIKCTLSGGVFSFSALDSVGDTASLTITAVPTSTGLASIVANPTGSGATELIVGMELTSFTSSTGGSIFLTDRAG